MKTSAPYIAYFPADETDFEEMLAIRVAAMRESQERVGRFDPQRARQRLESSFHPEHTRFIVVENRRVGFYTLRPGNDVLHLDHLYIHPDCQGIGIGSQTLTKLLRLSASLRMPVELGALRDSPANAFYIRHGFVRTSADEWDIHYRWEPGV